MKKRRNGPHAQYSTILHAQYNDPHAQYSTILGLSCYSTILGLSFNYPARAI